MILNSLTAFTLRIPFRSAFAHASAEREETQAVCVMARARGGMVGFGEGCPRPYVTGETLESVQRFVNAHRPALLATIRDVDGLSDWAKRHAGEIDANPAAWTAVELALLDLLGRQASRSVESLLGLPELSGRFRYTAVLGDATTAQFRAQLEQYLRAGFREFKIKLCGVLERDRAKAGVLASAGIAADRVRADANNLWNDAPTAIEYLAAVGFPFWALEEPLRPGDWRGLRRVGAALGLKVILDESVLRTTQLEALGDWADQWIVNLRVSKMGGLFRSLACAAEVRRLGLTAVVGAHVGETSLLTRAGLTLAQGAHAILQGQEGAFGTHLLAADVTDTPLMFGHGGWLDTALMPRRAGGGLELDVRVERIFPYATSAVGGHHDSR